MKKIFLAIAILFSIFTNYSQEKLVKELKQAYQDDKYDLIISKHSSKVKDYSSEAVYYVGMAYYMKENDEKVLELMNLSLKKDKTNSDAHFIKGMVLAYTNKFSKSIKSIKEAIKLEATSSHYLSGLGDVYMGQNDYQNALSAFIKATKTEEPIERAYVMIPRIYIQLNRPQKALEAFYELKKNISKDSGEYTATLYNIGMYECINKEYDKAEFTYKEFLELKPDDFEVYARLIQVYYAKNESDKAEPFKEKIYEAHKKGKLPESMRNMFCFEKFDWKDKLVFAHENLAIKEGELYYKHIFYVTNSELETEFTIQTENSPISEELGGPKYLLGMDKEGTHFTFQYGFKEGYDYSDLKKKVLLVLEDKAKVAASSRRGN